MSTEAAGSQQSTVIAGGTCYVLFAYDVGHAVDLDRAEQLITTRRKQRTQIKYKRRAPQSFQFSPAPLRLSYAAPQLHLAGFTTAESVEAVIYDFGGMCVIYSVPITGDLSRLLALSVALYDNQTLLEDAQRWVREVVTSIEPAVTRSNISTFVEDYAVFHIESMAHAAEPPDWVEANRTTIAQILRCETQPLSQQEISDALGCLTTYSRGDLALIDWNAAIIIGPDAEDVRTILELANVELLELRFLDEKLDQALAQAYDALTRRSLRQPAVFGSYRTDLRRVAQMQADSATLFEGVSNALKLIGDQYLARLYRATSARLHLPEWDEGILRKLQTLDSIYGKMSDQQSVRRMEVLEWIIILLIAVSIVLPFVVH